MRQPCTGKGKCEHCELALLSVTLIDSVTG